MATISLLNLLLHTPHPSHPSDTLVVQWIVFQATPLLFIDQEILERGWITFAKYADKKLSFTDCSIIELMKKKGIDHLASFDGGFDEIVSRIRY
ncbi:MAG: type II toxin-antitoxin system VapC family toxin [ANME-2 cluster archaeon]|nr:type II toxin-antitoxin system VapC family toxin [ANME-2 cluster archaeon]MBC2701963.1 type II toxin-antitoxin system VapC family toxin [ANME-2 cluster archaeon]MBC2708974.1 type II toxin-antitoxin system VapC family toxin [ANME-2 cluster archaeon]MBC2745760.1 type II toxin-antitoxin system VapC family toxin [ANME-2 cluster archaeon]MBC2764161.1 type II toxin-antitoxin system VapC family toxin [ANME-2 cluster archaeon]